MGDSHHKVAGTCPACGSRSLFLGSGGHVTCSWVDCSAPCAADSLLNEASEAVAKARTATEQQEDNDE